MSLQVKYSPVFTLVNELKIQDLTVKEESDRLKISGVVNTQYEKNIIWDKIKEIGGEAYSDIIADIKVLQNEYYHLHQVQSGESLSKIAKHYFKDAKSYMKIFEANKDQLSNPDLIKVGQMLKIPTP